MKSQSSSMKILFRIFTAPFAGLWALVLLIRHALYDRDILPSHGFPFPIIVLGNLTVGGTGKTPHSIYLMELFRKNGITPALLSRGYGRKTMGYREVLKGERPSLVGDEPLQMKLRLGDALVFVDQDRVHGIHAIKNQHPDVDAIVLDDALQHRRLSPGLSILLMRMDRPTHQDYLLPMGRLRDLRERLYAADAVVITQCKEILNDQQRQQWRKDLKLKDYQALFFSMLEYKQVVHLMGDPQSFRANSEEPLLAITGIAHPTAFLNQCKQFGFNVYPMLFPDHAPFDGNALERIEQKWSVLNKPRLIMTEKDAVKLSRILKPEMLQKSYVLPIDVKFMDPLPGEMSFDEWILSYFGAFQANH